MLDKDEQGGYPPNLSKKIMEVIFSQDILALRFFKKFLVGMHPSLEFSILPVSPPITLILFSHKFGNLLGSLFCVAGDPGILPTNGGYYNEYV